MYVCVCVLGSVGAYAYTDKFYVSLTKARVVWEGGTSIEKMPPLIGRQVYGAIS